MSTDKELARFLDHCLDQIQRGELSLEDCLRQHAEHAEELALLLTAAAAARQLAPAGPSAQFRASARARVLNLAGARKRKAPARAKRFPRSAAGRPRLLRWRPAYALGALFLALILLGGGVGAAYASNDALPGDALYGVKRGVEQITLTITLSDEAEGRLLHGFTERRIEEMQGLLEAGRVEDLDAAVAGYQTTVELALTVAEAGTGQLDALQSAFSQQEMALMAALERAPEQAVPALQAALSHAQHGLQTVEHIRSGGNPSELAPGQLKKSGEDQQSDGSPPGQHKRRDGRVPPGQLKKQGGEGEGLEQLPPGQQKKNVCDPDHPARGNRSDRLCPDQ